MLRTATEGDVELVRQWRNHPDVRAASLTRHVIPAPEHAAWWDRAARDPGCRVLIYERFGVPSGVVTFTDLDPVARTAQWGFYLDVAGLTERGELLPAWMEVSREALRYAFDDLALTVLYGQVLAGNAAVRAFNRRAGVREVGEQTLEIDGTLETVIRLEVRPQDVRTRRATPS